MYQVHTMLHGGLAAVVPGENTPNLIYCISAAELKRKKDVCSFQIYESGFWPPPPRQLAQFFYLPFDCFPSSSISPVPKGERKQVLQQSHKSLQITGVLGMTRGHKMDSLSLSTVTGFRCWTFSLWKGNWAEREHMTLHMSKLTYSKVLI